MSVGDIVKFFSLDLTQYLGKDNASSNTTLKVSAKVIEIASGNSIDFEEQKKDDELNFLDCEGSLDHYSDISSVDSDLEINSEAESCESTTNELAILREQISYNETAISESTIEGSELAILKKELFDDETEISDTTTGASELTIPNKQISDSEAEMSDITIKESKLTLQNKKSTDEEELESNSNSDGECCSDVSSYDADYDDNTEDDDDFFSDISNLYKSNDDDDIKKTENLVKKLCCCRKDWICQSVCKKLGEAILKTINAITLDDFESIEKYAGGLWHVTKQLNSFMNDADDEQPKVSYWHLLEMWQKVPFYWAVLADCNKINDSPFENFKRFYLNGMTPDNRMWKIYQNMALLVWNEMEGFQRLPFIMEAFIGIMSNENTDINNEMEMQRVVNYLKTQY